jgi:hypothetical protein
MVVDRRWVQVLSVNTGQDTRRRHLKDYQVRAGTKKVPHVGIKRTFIK